MTKITLDYSGVETDEISPFELVNNPENFLIISLKSNIFCKRCNKHLIIHKSKRCLTFTCGCGCRIIYARNKNGVKVSTIILKEEHITGYNGKC